MYLGQIMELSPADDLYDNPLHPYTISLLSAIPIPDPEVERTRTSILLQGDLPSPANPPHACRFHTRCPYVQPTRCEEEEPELRPLEGHLVKCHFAEEIKAGHAAAETARGRLRGRCDPEGLGAAARLMLLRVRAGELESGRQWVYAWLARDGVVYVGATALHPETRTWLHLHHEDPEIGRMRARFAELAGGGARRRRGRAAGRRRPPAGAPQRGDGARGARLPLGATRV